ncbi:hypothetical protein DFA_03085 [Cavenderia fasciculata]|uniref:Uncharacterized protein n=1 Tax=Cavenderia fasciculata TaxID=261658 RepID=F4PGK6_CACFS|nr:uncharacterized protein DFA_03085 [Cavenderia fasciculata]EGG24840.1 hypothetical protein DFA_03085 [Cavenderia fasciculata]|eukprot:XP_004362691.1 hypothetical protein DFA_03085 [Cavenderia fasciculata]
MMIKDKKKKDLLFLIFIYVMFAVTSDTLLVNSQVTINENEGKIISRAIYTHGRAIGKDLPSLTFMIKQYGVSWTLVGNVLSNYRKNDIKVVNGSFTLLSFLVLNTQQFNDSGLPDQSLSSLYFPNLTSLVISSLQKDGSINILYMVRNLSNLKTLAVRGLSIPYIPDGFPFTLNKLTELYMVLWSRFTQEYKFIILSSTDCFLRTNSFNQSNDRMIGQYIEPVPDGLGEGLMIDVTLAHLSSYFPSTRYIHRLPNSLCGAIYLSDDWPADNKTQYAADCFKCFGAQISPYKPYGGYEYKLGGYNYPCDIRVTSLYYKTNDTVIINGNNLQSSFQRDTPSVNGVSNFILNNQILEYKRVDLNAIQDRVVLGYGEKITVSIPVLFTRINLGSFITIDQQPFGINISINLNYNINIPHTMFLNGVACRKDSAIYIKDRLTCFFPLQISSQSTLLNYNIANIRNNEIYQSNFTRRMLC